MVGFWVWCYMVGWIFRWVFGRRHLGVTLVRFDCFTSTFPNNTSDLRMAVAQRIIFPDDFLGWE